MKRLSLAFFSIAFALSLSLPTLASYTDTKAESVDYLEFQGAIQSAETFNPDRLIQKAEALKILVTLMDPTVETADANETWFAPYIEWALQHDVLQGSTKTIDPEKNLRKVEALNWLFKVYGIGIPFEAISSRTDLYEDVSAEHPYYGLIKRAKTLGILSSDESSIQPYKSLTRLDYANLIYQFEIWKNTSAMAEMEESEFYKSDIFAGIWNAILSDFYLEPGYGIDKDALFQAAVKGMLQSLGDPFTSYLTPDQYSSFEGGLNTNTETAYVGEGNVWVLNIDSFGAETASHTNGLLKDLSETEDEPSAMVIDLRDNPGGYISAAVEIAGLFTAKDAVLTQIDYGRDTEVVLATEDGPYVGVPIHVLVNHGSASASEILAAALNDSADATIWGETTYGKGTAQELIQYWDGSILKITFAKWLTPGGLSLSGVGLEPDNELTDPSGETGLTNGTTDTWLKTVMEQLTS
jgi:C-terminal processing protease CtpA/Prc